jgi:hypothetical protein
MPSAAELSHLCDRTTPGDLREWGHLGALASAAAAASGGVRAVVHIPQVTTILDWVAWGRAYARSNRPSPSTSTPA